MEAHKTITIVEAMTIAKGAGKTVTRATLIQWIRKNNLGHQPAGFWGRWYIYKEKFERFIYGENYIERSNPESPETAGEAVTK